MHSSTSILLLLCSTLVSTIQVPVEYGTNENPSVKLPSEPRVRLDIHRTKLLRSNIFEIRNFDALQSNESVPKQIVPESTRSYVHLPEDQIRCHDDNDCAIHGLPLECRQELCQCKYPYCWVYTINTTMWPAVNVFTCSICGSLGSSCNETIRCNNPGQCMGDGFCHCKYNGEHDENGICWVVDTSWALMIALCSMGLILFFAVIVTAYNLYVTRPWQNGCGRRPAPDVTGRDSGNTKTPAFTVRDFYGYTETQVSSQTVQAVGQTADSSSMTAVSDYEIRENIDPEMGTSVQQGSPSTIESPGSPLQGLRCRPNESTTESSVRSSLSSNSSTTNSERLLISTSDNNCIPNGHSSGFSFSKVFNRNQTRGDDYPESTRF